MRWIIYIILIIMFSGCNGCREGAVRDDINSGQFEGIQYKKSAIHCLRDFLVDEDDDGEWILIQKPEGSTLLQEDLDGTDNPCLDFDAIGCGLYEFQYRITTVCCSSSTNILVNKSCCSNFNGSASCS